MPPPTPLIPPIALQASRPCSSFGLMPLLLLALLLSACGGKNGQGGPADSTAQQQDITTAGGDSSRPRIVFFGNSLTAGYGLDPQEAFPALIQRRLDSLGYNYQVVNAGLSGETTAGGLERVDWVLRQRVDVFVLELGGNDGLRGVAPEVSEKNLLAIVDKVRAKYPQCLIVLAGMEAPPNMGAEFTAKFRAMYPAVAKARNLTLIPFLLDGVGGVASLNLPDGIHPTAAGHRLVAQNVWAVLQTVLPKPQS